MHLRRAVEAEESRLSADEASAQAANEQTWTAGMARAPGRLLHLLHRKHSGGPEDSAKASVGTGSDPLQKDSDRRALPPRVRESAQAASWDGVCLCECAAAPWHLGPTGVCGRQRQPLAEGIRQAHDALSTAEGLLRQPSR